MESHGKSSLKPFKKLVIEERPISPFELQKADELFLTNTKQGIQSVSKYRKKEYNNIVATNLLGKLNTLTRLG